MERLLVEPASDETTQPGAGVVQLDWRQLRERHPRLIWTVVALKRWRTKVGIGLVGYCLVEGLWNDEIPFRLDTPNAYVIIGLALILTGLAFRLCSHGHIEKKEALATAGAYSLCRHPLYLGSILLTYGFCFLLDDADNFVVATAYFAVFYTVTIIWEEVRVAERYGEAHQEYCRSTPLLLPLGRFRAGAFSWAKVFTSGGLSLVSITLLFLCAIEVMALAMPAPAAAAIIQR